jgi:ABC-2 type transport system ATP-binding protein
MAQDKAIIVSTHILQEVEAVCTRAVVIDKGRIVADGTAEELQRRLPYHHAVAVRVPLANADNAKAALEQVDGVSKVEITGKADGKISLRALPQPEKEIAAAIAGALREQAIEIDELYVEKGRLDDVFRQITSHDGARRNA